MFRFEHPEIFIFYLLIPCLLGITFLLYKQYLKRLKGIANLSNAETMFNGNPIKSYWFRDILFTLTIFFLISSWINPQWGSKREKVEASRADIYIALDISKSMLARDMQPSRLERAKLFASDLIQSLKSERIGLILFAGASYLQMPLTSDYAAALMFVRSAHPDLAGTQGTAISESIQLASRNFSEDEAAQRALIVITDGEDHDGEAIESAADASENGLFTFTVGVGSEAGAKVPENLRGEPRYKRDANGQPITSKLNVALLREIAGVGGGGYVHIADGVQAINELKEGLSRIEKRKTEQRSFSSYQSYFQILAFIALFMLMLYSFLPENLRLK